MSTFDQIIPDLKAIFLSYQEFVDKVAPIYVNRDLNGRVRLVVSSIWEEDAGVLAVFGEIFKEVEQKLQKHVADESGFLLFESRPENISFGVPAFQVEGVKGLFLVDRLSAGSNWATIAAPTERASRVVFFSIKGGVGRSTAIAATAWKLAQGGKRVLVLDLDLESPGLSTSLLTKDRRPKFGITDWLVEDLVGNGDEVLSSMISSSDLSHDGDIFVVPAHGAESGEYVAKLGRVWMPKILAGGQQEGWSQRLQRLINSLEDKLEPDVILIDSRAGIDEVASACVTDLGASLVLLFALDGDQTWSGYKILFHHWRTTGVVRDIRERLQVVGALIPDLHGSEYLDGLRQEAWNLFAEELYDEVPAGVTATEDMWSFDYADEGSPHYAWAIRWNRGFNSLRSLHPRLSTVDVQEVDSVFGSLVDGITSVIEGCEQL